MKNKSFPSSQRGFTLVELMVVVIVIAVLAAIAVPVYRSYIDNARKQEAVQLLHQIRMKEALYFQENRRYIEATANPVLLPCNGVKQAWLPNRSHWPTLGVRPPTPAVYFRYNVVQNSSAAADPPTENNTNTCNNAITNLSGDANSHFPTGHRGPWFVACARGNLRAPCSSTNDFNIFFGISSADRFQRVYVKDDS